MHWHCFGVSGGATIAVAVGGDDRRGATMTDDAAAMPRLDAY